MPKIVPHRIPPADTSSYPLLVALLDQQGVLPEKNGDYAVNIECEDFSVIPKLLYDHPIIMKLTSRQMFDFDAESNLLPLPTNLFLAHCLNKSAYADPPIQSYVNGLVQTLDDTSRKFEEKSGEEPEKLSKLQAFVFMLQSSMREALDSARLYAATPYVHEDWAQLHSVDQSVKNKRGLASFSERALRRTLLQWKSVPCLRARASHRAVSRSTLVQMFSRGIAGKRAAGTRARSVLPSFPRQDFLCNKGSAPVERGMPSPGEPSMTLRILAALAVLCAASPALAAEQPYSPAAMAAAQEAGKPVVVHVTAPWCSTCQAQKPIIAALLSDPRFKDVTVLDVDFDSQKALLRKLGVRTQSTFIAFHGRKETARSSGDTSRASVAKLFDKAV